MSNETSKPEEQGAPAPAPARGILVTINENGMINSQVLGHLNEAEFLGIGEYLRNVPVKDGLIHLIRSESALRDVVEQMAKLLEEMVEKGEEKCLEAQSSDYSPSLDSGQSSESSQDQSEE
jgi:hypothetical protein